MDDLRFLYRWQDQFDIVVQFHLLGKGFEMLFKEASHRGSSTETTNEKHFLKIPSVLWFSVGIVEDRQLVPFPILMQL